MTQPTQPRPFGAFNPDAPTLVVTTGLPGSGKSTWAIEWVNEDPTARVRLERDLFRTMLHGTAHHGQTWQELQVNAAIRHAALGLLSAGHSVVISATNVRRTDLIRWAQWGWTCAGANFFVRSFWDVPLSTCIMRNDARKGTAEYVPEDVIRTMHHDGWSDRGAATAPVGYWSGVPA